MEIKKKSLLSRIITAATAAVIGISTAVSSMQDIKAEAWTLNQTQLTYYHGHYDVYFFNNVTNDGYSPFCIEPQPLVDYYNAYKSAVADNTSFTVHNGSQYVALSNDMKRYIALANYYGYPNGAALPNGKNASQAAFVATQFLVWEITQGKRTLDDYHTTQKTSYFSGNNAYRSYINGGTYPDGSTASQATEYYDAIVAAIQKYGVKPSFGVLGSTTDANYPNSQNYNLYYNPDTKEYERTITDKNSVIKNFDITTQIQSQGYSASVSGNQLTVTAPKNSNDYIIVKSQKKLPAANFNQTLMIYYSSASMLKQKMARGTRTDPVSFKLKFEKSNGNMKIVKKFVDANGKAMSTSQLTDEDVSKVAFRLFYYDDDNDKLYDVKVSKTSAGKYRFDTMSKNSVNNHLKATANGTSIYLASKSDLTATIEDLPSGTENSPRGTYYLREVGASDAFGGDVVDNNTNSDVTVIVSKNSTKTKNVTNEHVNPDYKQASMVKNWKLNTSRFDSDGDGELSHADKNKLNAQIFFLVMITYTDSNGTSVNKYLKKAKYINKESNDGILYNVYDANCTDSGTGAITSSALTGSAMEASFVPISYYRDGIKIINLPLKTTKVTFKEMIIADQTINTPNDMTIAQIVKRIDECVIKDDPNDHTLSDGKTLSTNYDYGITMATINKRQSGKDNTEVTNYIRHFVPNNKTVDDHPNYVVASVNGKPSTGTNTEKYIKLGFTKVINGTTEKISGGEFMLYRYENSKYVAMLDKGIPANKSLTYTYFSGKYEPGYKYYVKEITPPPGFKPLSDYKEINVNVYSSDGNTGHVSTDVANLDLQTKFVSTIGNTRVQGKISIHKVNEKGQAIKGVKFNVYSGKTATGTPVDTLTTNESGNDTTGLLDLGTYTVKEVSTVSPYVIEEGKETVTLDSDNYDASLGYVPATVNYTNFPVRCVVNVYKTDNQNNKLSGAVFTIKYAAPYTDYTGKEHVAGEKVCDIETNDQGFATTYPEGATQEETDALADKQFPLFIGAKYKMTETTVPAGYQSDGTATDIEFTATDYNNGKTSVLTKTYNKVNIPKTASIKAVKYVEINGVKKSVPLGGALFTLYAGDEVTIDGTIYHKDDPIEENVKSIASTGKASFSTELPIGHKYYIKEVKPPKGYTMDTSKKEFNVTNENVGHLNDQLFYDKPQQAEITVIKKNKNTLLDGAKFSLTAAEDIKLIDGSIWKYNNKEIKAGVEIANGTTVNGKIVFPEVPAGYYYTITETEAPQYYINSGYSKTFKINGNTTGNVIKYTAEVQNDYQPGSITVYKKAEIDGVKTNVLLAGAKFTLYAVSDVRDPDDPSTILYHANEEIQTLETGTNGKVEFKKVPVGYQYKVKEISAPENYVNTHEEKIFTLQYSAELEYVTHEESIYDPYQNGEISVVKVKTNPNGSISNEPITTDYATFNLVAAEPITMPDGTTLYNTNEVIDTVNTSLTNGKAIFTKKVPVGFNYKLVEIKAPNGYVRKTTDTTFTLNGNTEIQYVMLNQIIGNSKNSVEFSKRSAVDNSELAGAKIEIRDARGNVVKDIDGNEIKWTSDGTNHVVKGIAPGTYTMVETASPNGYKIATSITFTIDDLNNVTSSDVTIEYDNDIPLVVMVDDVYKAEFSKRSAVDNSELAGASIEIRDKDNKVAKDAKGNELKWVSDGTNHLVTMIMPGNYTMVETASPNGYKIATSIPFTVKKDGSVTSSAATIEYDNNIPLVVMTDDVYKAEFSKRTAVDNSELSGAKIEIRTSTGAIAKDAKGNELKWTSDGTNHLVTMIMPGNYTMVETASPQGYKIATSIPFTVHQDGSVTSTSATVEYDGDIPLLVMVDEIQPVEFSKRSVVDNNELPGATIEIRKANGEVAKDILGNVQRWTSDGTVHTAYGMLAGTYTMVETASPNGYKIATSITFTIDVNGKVTNSSVALQYDDDVPMIVMVDDVYKAEFSKRSAVDSSELAGAKIEIRDKDNKIAKDAKGNELKWTSDGTNHLVTMIMPGNYTMVETASPNGYKIATSIKFTVNTDGSITSGDVTVEYDNDIPLIVMTDDVINVQFSKRSAVDNSELAGAKIEIRDKNDKIAKDADGNVLKWTSDGTDHVVSKIMPGDYTMVETASPNGYLITTSIRFTVKKDGSVTSSDVTVESKNDIPLIVMVDNVTKVKVIKRDKDTEQSLAGAVFQIKDKETGTVVVPQWTNPKGGKEIDGVLVVNKTYILEELKTPKGYLKSAPVEFTVANTQEVQPVYMDDVPVSFKVLKLDAETNLPVKGAVLALYNSQGTEIARWTTDGTAKEFKNIEFGEYTLKELQAPKGYNTGADLTFTVDENTDDVEIKYYNNAGITMPETGGSGTVGMIIGGTVLLLAGCVYFISRKRKKED